MIAKYLSFSISIAFMSWMVGILFQVMLKNTNIYKGKLSQLNFISNEHVNTWIGLDPFKWIVKNTFFKFFNPNLKLSRKIAKEDLLRLREEMTKADINHVIAFIFASFFAVYRLVQGEFLFALTIIVVNLLMNLYPSLLQQQNKRRVDQFLQKGILQ